MFFNPNCFEYSVKLDRLEEKRKTAKIRNLDYCVRCGTCCWKRPGNVGTDEIDLIAQHLKITKEELFKKYLVVDEISFMLCLTFARVHQSDITGTYINTDETYSIETPCIFLDDKSKKKPEKRCKIYEIRPRSCSNSECWSDRMLENFPEWSKEELIKLGWDGEKNY